MNHHHIPQFSPWPELETFPSLSGPRGFEWMQQNIQVRFPPPLSIAIGLDLLFLIFWRKLSEYNRKVRFPYDIYSIAMGLYLFLAVFVSIWRGNAKSKVCDYMLQEFGTFWTLQLEANFRLPSCPVPSDQEIGSPIVDWEGYHYPTILPPNPLEFSNTSGNFRSYITAAAQ